MTKYLDIKKNTVYACACKKQKSSKKFPYIWGSKICIINSRLLIIHETL